MSKHWTLHGSIIYYSKMRISKSFNHLLGLWQRHLWRGCWNMTQFQITFVNTAINKCPVLLVHWYQDPWYAALFGRRPDTLKCPPLLKGPSQLETAGAAAELRLPSGGREDERMVSENIFHKQYNQLCWFLPALQCLQRTTYFNVAPCLSMR